MDTVKSYCYYVFSILWEVLAVALNGVILAPVAWAGWKWGAVPMFGAPSTELFDWMILLAAWQVIASYVARRTHIQYIPVLTIPTAPEQEEE